MEKALAIRIKETKETIVETINKAELPPCIVQLIIQDVSKQVDILAKEELRVALSQETEE